MAKNRNIGQVLKKKDGQGVYIKISEDVTLKKGDFVNVDDPRKLPDILLGLGAINEELHAKMTEQAAKIPDFVKFTLSVKNNAEQT